MKKLIIFCFLGGLLGVSIICCKSQTPGIRNGTSVSGSEPTESFVDPNDTLLYFERLPCNGKCPQFSFLLFNNGNALFIGMRFTVKLGAYYGFASASDLKNIGDSILQMAILDMPPLFPEKKSTLSDQSITKTVVKYNGERQEIINYGFENDDNKSAYRQFEVMLRFESYIDDLIKTLNLRKVEEIKNDP